MRTAVPAAEGGSAAMAAPEDQAKLALVQAHAQGLAADKARLQAELDAARHAATAAAAAAAAQEEAAAAAHGAAAAAQAEAAAREAELERRVVLSQWIELTQEAGSLPPQETGLVSNSW